MNEILDIENINELKLRIIEREKLWIKYVNILCELQNGVFATARAHSISISQKSLDECDSIRKELKIDNT